MYRLGQELLHAEKHGIPVHRVSIEFRAAHADELGLAICLHPTGSHIPAIHHEVSSSPWSDSHPYDKGAVAQS